MFLRMSIRVKLWILVAMLMVIVGMLAFSGFQGVFAYRWLAKSISYRSAELPVAASLAHRIGDVRITFSRFQKLGALAESTGQLPVEAQLAHEELSASLLPVKETLRSYRARIAANEQLDEVIGDHEQELATVSEIEAVIVQIEGINRDKDWVFEQPEGDALDDQLDRLALLAGKLPTFLQQRMHDFAGDVRGQYRTWIGLTLVASIAAVGFVALLLALFYYWIFRPLRILIKGSRRVAQGDVGHRIELPPYDEIGELAAAMNEMADFFQKTTDELNEQVRERTKEVVRSERLASVGFLAAGVAHEINNPLAAIAWSAESLESRLDEIIQVDDAKSDEDHDENITTLRHYLRMIQDEAYRCSQITSKLLDFSRLGDMEMHEIGLRELVQGVIDVVRHVGKYKEKQVELLDGDEVIAPVNAQEMKQVVLNLITNGLDSLDAGGKVTVSLRKRGEEAELLVADNGCGMDAHVLENLYEPFFTRRRDGSGTGLGLSITYRIVSDHGGRIAATSKGPGCGSEFRVNLPLIRQEREYASKQQAA